MSPQQMGNAIKAPVLTTNQIGSGNNDQDGKHLGINASDYKSKTKERAVPKQININIQNLMKVDSIDLTNENNAEIIGRLKREVAYALVEAASDGTMMLNNLTT